MSGKRMMIRLMVATTMALAIPAAKASTEQIERQAIEAFRTAAAEVDAAGTSEAREAAMARFTEQLAALKASGLTFDELIGALEERELITPEAKDTLVAMSEQHSKPSDSDLQGLAEALEGPKGATYGYGFGASFMSYWYWYVVGFGGSYFVVFY